MEPITNNPSPGPEQGQGRSTFLIRHPEGLAIAALVILWPFIYYYRLIIPGCSLSLSLGNDFIHLYFKYKLYLLDMLAGGHFPLWSPAEAAGYPFYSSPFTQTFYPLNLLLVLFYKISGGYSPCDHQVFTVLGLSIYGFGLYLWLRLITVNRRAVVFAVLVIVSSFKLGEILRFPNAVHTAAWMPWMLYGVTLCIQKERSLKGGVILFVCSIMFLTGGYPYYVYYALFLIPPYVILLLFPATRKALIENDTIGPMDVRRFLAVVFLPVSAALAVCAPYLYKMFQLVNQTVRAGLDYDFSTSHTFGPTDTLGSLIYPPSAQTEGWYYFSSLGLLMIALFVIRIFSARHTSGVQARFLVVMIVWLGLISYITYGRHSYLFDLFWNYLPGFARLRVWGRLNIILLPLLGILLARSYAVFEDCLSGQTPNQTGWQRLSPPGFAALSGVVLLIAGAQMWLYGNKVHDPYWLVYFKELHGTEGRFIVFGLISFVVLTSVLLLAAKRPFTSTLALKVVFVLCLAVALMDMRQVGIRQWTFRDATDHRLNKMNPRIQKSMKAAFSQPRCRIDNDSLIFNPSEETPLLPVSNVGIFPDWYFDRYVSFGRRIFSKDNKPGNPGWPSYYETLMGLNTGKRIFFSKEINQVSAKTFVLDAVETEKRLGPRIHWKLKYYDGDRLRLSVFTPEPVYVSFIDNWDPDWRATVNGRDTPIERLLGTFKSLLIYPGTSEILFSYRPFALFN